MDDPALSKHPTHIGVFDAKTRLSELLEQVASGAVIVITKHGTPIARLVPPEAPRPDKRKVKALFSELSKLSKEAVVGPALGHEEIRDAIDEGRE